MPGTLTQATGSVDDFFDREFAVTGFTTAANITGWASIQLPVGESDGMPAGVQLMAPGEAVLVHRYAEQPLFARELAVLAAERGLRLVDLPGPRHEPLNDPRLLAHLVPDLAHREVYVCGPGQWAAEVAGAALAAGLPPEHLHLETFSW